MRKLTELELRSVAGGCDDTDHDADECDNAKGDPEPPRLPRWHNQQQMDGGHAREAGPRDVDQTMGQ